jgi:parvulin-like peptidyl-prolyl isomerase
MLSHSYTLLNPSEVSRIFGDSFTEQVFKLELGQWQKPIKSGYGWHLVKVNQKLPAQIGTFEEHKAEIFNKLLEECKEKANQKFYQSISDRYFIQLDKAVLNEYPYLKEVIKEDA